LELDTPAVICAFDAVTFFSFSLCEREAFVEAMPVGQAFDSPAINVMKSARKSASTAAPTTLRVLRWVFNRTFGRPNMAQRLVKNLQVRISPKWPIRTLMWINNNCENEGFHRTEAH
jgi:hypothetical protein